MIESITLKAYSILSNGGMLMSWNKTVKINTNIENLWNLFSEENYQKIMPQVLSHKLVQEDNENNIKIYEEVYREGKRKETYLITEHTVVSEDKKQKDFNFTISNAIYSEGTFLLEKIDENNTRFTYSGFNEGQNFFFKMMLKLASKKNEEQVVNEFIERVIKYSK